MSKRVYLSFDLWNTIISPNPDYRIARNQKLAEISGKSIEEVEQIHKDLKKLFDHINDRGYSIPSDACWQMLYDNLGNPARRIYPYQLVVDYPPDITKLNISFINEISEKYSVSVLSNTNFISGDELVSILSRQGIRTERIDWHFSNEYSIAKPNVKFFELLNFPKNDPDTICCHFGDNYYADGQGASDYGIDSRHVESPVYLESVVTKYLKENNAL